MTEYNQAQVDLINKLLGREIFFRVPPDHQRTMLKNMRAYIKARDTKEARADI